MSESFLPDRWRRRIDSATDRASVRESGAISTVTDLPPEPRVATSSGSASKSGSRRMKSVAQSRISWYDRRLWVSGRRRPPKRLRMFSISASRQP